MASLAVVTAPTVEPVTVIEAKTHLRVTSTAEDTLIAGRIKAARRWVERYCRRGLMTQTLRLRMDEFPDDGDAVIRLPWGTATSVTSITYVDGVGTTQTLATDHYQTDLDSVPARIAPAYGYCWPVTRCQFAAVTVTYVVGSATADDDVKAALLMVLADLYENREASIIGASYIANPAVQSLLAAHRCDVLGAELDEAD